MSLAVTEANTRLDQRWLWASLFFAVAIFAQWPRLDLVVASQYHTPAGGFVHGNEPLVLAMYHWTPLVGRIIVGALALIALLSPWLAAWMRRRGRGDLAHRCLGPWRHMAVVAVLCGVLGPGLVVEAWFKNAVGRPRPVQVVEFGGSEPFHGPFEPGPNPAHHRSFVSSHAATGFWLLSLGLTCGPVWRRRWLWIGLLTGSAIGAGRMMQGGHFLSDIVFAFYAVWIPCQIVMALDRWRLRRRPPAQLAGDQ